MLNKITRKFVSFLLGIYMKSTTPMYISLVKLNQDVSMHYSEGNSSFSFFQSVLYNEALGFGILSLHTHDHDDSWQPWH